MTRPTLAAKTQYFFGPKLKMGGPRLGLSENSDIFFATPVVCMQPWLNLNQGKDIQSFTFLRTAYCPLIG